ncbi:TPA: polysaccharide pyruvyl transferase family protein [Vibrio parahaemolyticus]|nr:polysaccharide pyruvyl transferase family protein [Vibrio parahaemolyticus]MDG2548088.1 polysaccharide pyruvyl transferase family protein [Vibrio parahaemolyticus]MDG2558200.1 polysaccharide pyruvyl transferase family protein [Vibrio parahaemolyticus]HCE3404579.1 polysaccharide pyruvyl transferase family protein [Vibrio parahaemolyticus]
MLKKNLRNQLERIYINNPSKICNLFKGRSLGKNNDLVFLIPPTDGGSLGDEAMIVASLSELSNTGKKVKILSGDKELSSRLSKYGISPDVIYVRGLYNGFLPLLKYVSLIKKYKPNSVYLIGADVMDGFYSEYRSISRLGLLDVASSYVDDVRLLGFSFNEEPRKSIVRYMKLLHENVKLQPRDPVSAKRLTDRTIKNRLVSDLAFSLCNDKEFFINKTPASEWMDKNKYICVNLNAIHRQKYGEAFSDIVESLVKEINYKTNFHIVFVSHDFRKFDNLTDLEYAKLIAEKIGLDEGKDYTLIDQDLTASNLKYLASKSEFTLTGRMHFAIGALGNSVPVIMFGYQGKQEGLAQHFQFSSKDIVIEPTSSVDDSLIKLNLFIENLDDNKEKVKSRVSIVKELSRSNMQI